MMPGVRIAAHVLALMIGWGGTPDAQALSRPCGPLKEVASLAMTMLPDGARASVPLVINGKPVHLLVDTGAGLSSLTKAAATMIDMRLRDSEGMHLVDKDGAVIHRYYLADSFQLGGLTAKRIIFMQSADPGEGLSGTIGPDLMARYDVEMDFSEQKLTYFSQDHCPGHVVHWSSDAVTQVPISLTARAKDYPPPLPAGGIGGLSSDFVEFEMAHQPSVLGKDIRTQVVLDGRTFTAVIDTGLDISTINSDAALRYFDVALDAPGAAGTHQDRPPAPQSSPGTEAVTVTGFRDRHRFHTLTFGGVTVVNPLFVLKLSPANAHRVGSPQSPDITIGMNVLRKLHLYFAFGEHMLYVSAVTREVEPEKR